MAIFGWSISNGGKMKPIVFSSTLILKPFPWSQRWSLHSFTFHFQVSCVTPRTTHSYTLFTFFVDSSSNHHSCSFFKILATWRWTNKFSIEFFLPFSKVSGDNSTTLELCYFLCPTYIFHVSCRQVACLSSGKRTILCAGYT